jgi:hypothetical protein
MGRFLAIIATFLAIAMPSLSYAGSSQPQGKLVSELVV